MRIVTVCLALLLLTGCSWFSSWWHSNPQPGPVVKPHPTSARAQKYMQTSIDLDLEREKRGEHAPSGKANWREYWQWRISIWRTDKQSRQYEQYFVRKRKEMGLPELKRL